MLKRGKNKVDKLGQVSIFIVIGLLITGVIVIGYAFREKISSVLNIGSGISPEARYIDSAIESCSKQRAIDAIRIVGLQGGYVNLPYKYFVTNISNIAYGYYDGKNTLAKKSQIEKEISYYVQLTIPYCIENEFNGFNLTKSDASVSTKINPNSVSISAKMPISATKGGNTFFLNREYESDIPIKLGDIIDAANDIIDKEMKDPNYIDITYLVSIGYYVMAVPHGEGDIIYVITDDNKKTDGIPYSFMFANKIKVIKGI